ncbi:MAG: nitrous oxide reductase family maturation protein NosD [Candidatus Hermodarchaeota archaeon]
MKKKAYRSIILGILLISLIGLQGYTNIFLLSNDTSSFFKDNTNETINNTNDTIDEKKKIKEIPKESDYWEYSFMFIQNDNWATAGYDCIDVGLGTADAPHIIENVTIDTGGAGNAMLLSNCIEHFIFRNCTFTNAGSSNAGVGLVDVSNGQFINCNISNNLNYGIYFSGDCENITISNCLIKNNDDTGIYIYGSGTNMANFHILNNNITENLGSGIYVNTIDALIISGNIIKNHTTANRDGIFAVYISNSNITDNKIENNNRAGIYAWDYDYGMISGNLIRNNAYGGTSLPYAGLYMYSSCSYNKILKNNITENKNYGIHVNSNNDYNDFIGNSITNNVYYGLYIRDTDSDYNEIYDNYFIANTNHVYNYGTNYYDNGIWLGNYWDDYGGYDNNGDGIGDTSIPYNIPNSANDDNFPIYGNPYHNGSRIFIDGDYTSGYESWAWATSRAWCSGSGTINDPYVIEGLTIDAMNSGSGIYILDTDYLRIEDCTCINSSGSYIYDAGIRLNNVNYAEIINNNCTRNGQYSGSYGSGIVCITMANSTISGNNVDDNNRYGLRLTGCNFNTIVDNTITETDATYNFYMSSSNNNTIIRNDISEDATNALYISSCNGNEITGNVFYNSYRGLLISSATSDFNTIWNNTFYGNTMVNAEDYGVGSTNKFDNGEIGNSWDDYVSVDLDDDGIGDTEYLIYDDDIESNNYVNDTLPIYDDGHNGGRVFIDDDGSFGPLHTWSWISKQSWCTGSGTWRDPYIIEGLTIDAQLIGSCISIKNSQVYFTIQDCHTYNAHNINSQAGIRLENTNFGTLYNNNCSANGATSLGTGIYLHSSNYNNILNNEIKDNGFFGILLAADCENNLIQDNNITRENRGSRGLVLDECEFNLIKRNNITDFAPTGGMGLHLLDSDNNNVTENIMSNCYFNSRLYDSYNNKIWKNYYYNEVYDHATDNTGGSNDWDNETIGNYWDDYGGVDADDDGIGDSSYTVGSGVYDDHPIWWDSPLITIVFPDFYDMFGSDSPDYEVSISRGVYDSIWYNVEGNDNITSTGLTGKIDQDEWSPFGNGTVEINFYVNDSQGYESSTSVTVYKDLYGPNITITLPKNGSDWGNIAPDYALSYKDWGGLNETWYRLYNGSIYSENISISGSGNIRSGIIDQTAWDLMGNGTLKVITITFFANDTFGNLNYKNIKINKITTSPIVSISTPIDGSFSNQNPPIYNITLSGGLLNETWYGIKNETGSFVAKNVTLHHLDQGRYDGAILSGFWNQVPNGTYELIFYCNNTSGEMASDSIIAYKDVYAPEITVNDPTGGTYTDPPNYALIISEGNLDTIWYTFDDGQHNYTANDLNGYISSEAWDSIGAGNLVYLIFYANDSAGNIGSADKITIIKSSTTIIYISSGGGGGGGSSDKEEDDVDWIVRAAIGGAISAGVGLAIKQSYSSAKKRRILMDKTIDNFDRIDNVEHFLKDKLGYEEWEKLQDPWERYKKREITKKDFIKQSKKTVGDRFTELFKPKKD